MSKDETLQRRTGGEGRNASKRRKGWRAKMLTESQRVGTSRAYVRDAVSANEYEPACQKLLAQFKTLSASLKHTVPDVEKFIQTYNLDCPLATRRLIHVGMPATLELGRAGVPESRNSAVSVAETVQYFITAMDSLKLNMVAVDQVFPILSDLLQSMHRVAELKPDFAGKIKMKEWIGKLHAMPASQELQEDEVRQLLFDLEFGYNAFMASLGPQTSFGNSP